MTNLNFKLSIIIPIYNNSEFLKPMLRSLVQQKQEKKKNDVQIITVDDGSTEDMRFLDEYFPELVVIHKENGGCASARNAGLRIAQGEYVTFLDADDAIEDDYLETVYNDCFRGYDYVTYHWKLDNGMDAGRSPYPHLPNYNVWSYIFRKAAIDGVWFDENRNAADDWAWLQIAVTPRMTRYDSEKSLVIYNTHNYNSLTKRVERGEISEFKSR